MTSALPPSLTEPINIGIPSSHDPDNSRNCTALHRPLGDGGSGGTRVNSLSLGIYSLVKPLSVSFPVNALLCGAITSVRRRIILRIPCDIRDVKERTA
jgi:hypothetical protein